MRHLALSRSETDTTPRRCIRLYTSDGEITVERALDKPNGLIIHAPETVQIVRGELIDDWVDPQRRPAA